MEIRKFSTYCNTYVLLTESSAVVIDPFEFTPEINSLLNHSGIQHRAVVLTHGHFDHIKDATLVREKTGAKIFIHKCDEECLLYPHFTLCALFGQTLNPFSPDETFEDGAEIKVGDITLKVIHTPGHTKGSSCFKTGNLLFTGDTLFEGSIGRTDFPRSDMSEMISSLKRLKALKGDFKILAGHGEETTLETEKRQNMYLSRV